jgi:GMP synthase (glutamine-hydrolysing)
MRRPRLCLLNASYNPTDTRRNFRRELDADLVEFHTPEGEIPPAATTTPFEAFDGCVVTGSRASVYWDEAWIDDLRQWLDDAIAAGMPCLGICYGHQLLADVLGGTVEDMGEYEIGYQSVDLIGDSLLFDGVDAPATVFETHSDRVSALPAGADLIAENDHGIQGFHHGDVFGVQFHPEYDRPTAETVTRGKETLSEERIGDVLAGITDDNYAAACKTKQLFENFTAFVRERRHQALASASPAE